MKNFIRKLVRLHVPTCVYECEKMTTGKDWCRKSFHGFVCTRKKGHTGRHSACSEHEHDLITWEVTENGTVEYTTL